MYKCSWIFSNVVIRSDQGSGGFDGIVDNIFKYKPGYLSGIYNGLQSYLWIWSFTL